MGLKDSIRDSKLWSLRAVTFPDFDLSRGEVLHYHLHSPGGATVPSLRREVRAKTTQFAVVEEQALNVGAQLHCVPTEGLFECL